MGMFLAAMAVLNLVLFGPVTQALGEREAGTTKLGHEAEDLNAEARRIEADYGARMREAREQAATSRSKLRDEGQAEASRIVEGGRKVADGLAQKLGAELSVEIEASRKSLPSLAKAISGSMVARLLGRSA